MRIGFDDAKRFLDELKPSDNICLIFHDDLDGLASGVLFYNWCEKKGIEDIKIKIFCSEYFIGDDHKSCNKIIVADIFPRGFKMLNFSREQQVLYTDHHPSDEKLMPPNVLEYRTTNEGYIPSSRTTQELTGLKKWLGVCGVLGDYGELYPENEKYLSEFLDDKGITLGEYKVGVSNVLSNCIIYFKEDLISFFNILKEKNKPEECDDLREYSNIIENEIEKGVSYYKKNVIKLGNVNYCFVNFKYDISKVVLNIISREFPEEVFMSAKTSPRDKEIILISLRSQGGNANLNEFIKEVVNGIENAGAGGHKKAVGGDLKRKDLPLVKKRIEELSLKMFK